ncbi:MAG: LysR family transcriptional regulator [Pseudomonadota bacterium]|nr:LysR family transcriptional regulator [Pseudomonadota bacterium]MEC9122137.1 LysR family transcriptional regulator [Pseudomonadota bacterium]
MDLRDLELIEAVPSTGSLYKAFVELSVPQPTLSKRFARLESTVGTELFFRYSTGLVATPVADYVPAQLHQARSQLRDIKRHMELMTSLDSGELRLEWGQLLSS